MTKKSNPTTLQSQYKSFSSIALTEKDLFLFNEGSHLKLYEKLGSHLIERDGKQGTHFAVWAPNAEKVTVMGSFNGWDGDSHSLHPIGSSGIWTGFFEGIAQGDIYKYRILNRHSKKWNEKADPFAIHAENPPKTASIVWEAPYQWKDREWMKIRAKKNNSKAPMSIYEIHLGSWRRKPEEGNRFLSYREMAPLLVEYCQRANFTHVEFMPVAEHPFGGSWGYQITGYFAPTSRFGTPEDFKFLIDTLHQHGIGAIIDWVPSHFPTDSHGLAKFDGTALYEHEDPKQGFHPDWGSLIFNYGRHEVRSFLLSNAFYWLEQYHIDGLRVDAVASMLYLDYSRKAGEWVPNQYGGKENIAAIDFLQRFNTEVYREFPDTQTIAEESTAWPGVSRPTYAGGLGFGMKWDMGWMHDTLRYVSNDPVHRQYHHHELTFRMIYAFQENFVLALSHDEVVHGKGSLLGKMPGDDWQKFANLRLLYSLMYGTPGKKLMFMGGEFGQGKEWAHDDSLEWHLLEKAEHKGLFNCFSDLNKLYQQENALHEWDWDSQGFEWIDCSDTAQSIFVFLRKGKHSNEPILAVFNMTPIPRENYRIGVPVNGFWKEIFNSDAKEYGGSGLGNFGGHQSADHSFHGRPASLSLTLPPLAAVFLKPDPKSQPGDK